MPPLTQLEPSLTEVALAIAWRSNTVVQCQKRLLLPAGTCLALIDWPLPRWSRVEVAVERAASLQGLVEEAFPAAPTVANDPEPTVDELAKSRQLSGAAATVRLITYAAQRVAAQAEHGHERATSAAHLIHAAVPYDEAAIRGAEATPVTYGHAPVSPEALIDILAGRAKPEGMLPVCLEALPLP